MITKGQRATAPAAGLASAHAQLNRICARSEAVRAWLLEHLR